MVACIVRWLVRKSVDKKHLWEVDKSRKSNQYISYFFFNNSTSRDHYLNGASGHQKKTDCPIQSFRCLFLNSYIIRLAKYAVTI